MVCLGKSGLFWQQLQISDFLCKLFTHFVLYLFISSVRRTQNSLICLLISSSSFQHSQLKYNYIDLKTLGKKKNNFKYIKGHLRRGWLQLSIETKFLTVNSTNFLRMNTQVNKVLKQTQLHFSTLLSYYSYYSGMSYLYISKLNRN